MTKNSEKIFFFCLQNKKRKYNPIPEMKSYFEMEVFYITYSEY